METKILETEYYVSFSLGNELFGFKVSKVLEVLENTNISQVPEAPENIIGVVNFRGEIVPVIDLNSRFKIRQKEGLNGVIVVIDLFADNEKILIGVKVDKVLGITEVDTKDIKNAPEVGLSFNPKFIDGMVNKDEGILLLINPDLLVNQSEMAELEKTK